MTAGFYRAFEDNFRGSHNTIRRRLYVYLPFIRPLLDCYPSGDAIDLGCGRGEWLELLSDEGFSATGIDLDDDMLQACREKGLTVELCDAVLGLQQLPDESQVLVSAFHLVEHISFESLRELIRQAIRVLKPGGLIILETPNSENLVVGASTFYLDPTHLRPIPPQLLAFVHEYSGFKRTKILRLQEAASVLSSSAPSLLSVLNGVSPDYAVVAQKDGPASIYELLSNSFHASYGVTLEELATRFQHRLDTELIEAKGQAEQALAVALQAQVKAEQSQAQLAAVYTSSSWRITAPLRRVFQSLRVLRQSNVRSRTKKAIRSVLQKPISVITTSHRLKRLLVAGSRHLGVAEQLKTIYWRIECRDRGLLGRPSATMQTGDYLGLHPRAREIYRDLTSCMKLRQEEKH